MIDYQKLDLTNFEIRIVTLEPGENGDVIRCSLAAVRLNENPKYEALSYVWGDSLDQRDIIVNDQTVSVTKNLESAFKCLRRKDIPRPIWADAICINQADLDERSNQVTMMGMIYSQCQTCQIWLGDEDELPFHRRLPPTKEHCIEASTINAFTLYIETNRIRSVQPISSEQASEASSVDVQGAIGIVKLMAEDKHFYEMPFYKITEFPGFDPCEIWHNARRSLLNILSRPYWNRTWIVQEAVLAPNAIINLGAHRLDIDLLFKAEKNLRKHLWDANCCKPVCGRLWELRDGEGSLANVVNHLQEFDRAKDFHKSGSQVNHLHWHMMIARGRGVTNPRDAIYGFLGIIPALLGEGVVPDYTVPIGRLYSMTTKQHIQQRPELRILWWVPTTCPNRFNLPSWALDWTLDVPRIGYQHYKAYGPFRKHEISCTSTADEILPIEAFVIGRVKRILSPPSDPWIPSALISALTAWQSLANVDDRTLWRTIFADSPVVNTNAKRASEIQRMQDDDVAAIESWWNWVQGLPPNETMEELWPFPQHDYAECQTTFIVLHMSTVFLLLENGKIGVAPNVVEEGDILVIAKGSPNPLVLRSSPEYTSVSSADPDTDRYRFMGCCYLDGVMCGEAVTEEVQWEVMHLC